MTYQLTQQRCCAVDVADEKGRGRKGRHKVAVAHPRLPEATACFSASCGWCREIRPLRCFEHDY
jgi:hypothetical protein